MMKSTVMRVLLLSASVCGVMAGGAVHAAFPEKPVKYVIPFAPGGESDIAARFQQLVFRKKFGQEMIIESKPGAGGALAAVQAVHTAFGLDADGEAVIYCGTGR